MEHTNCSTGIETESGGTPTTHNVAMQGVHVHAMHPRTRCELGDLHVFQCRQHIQVRRFQLLAHPHHASASQANGNPRAVCVTWVTHTCSSWQDTHTKTHT